ncbi:protein of unknown function [Paraburkholderia kururiensis]
MRRRFSPPGSWSQTAIQPACGRSIGPAFFDSLFAYASRSDAPEGFNKRELEGATRATARVRSDSRAITELVI